MAESSRKFRVCHKTVQRYVSKAKSGASLAPEPQGGSRKTFGDNELRREVGAMPSATLKGHGKTLSVSNVTIWKRFRQLKIARKNS